MPKNDETVFINCLQMDFPSAPELELFLKSLDEVWTETLYCLAPNFSATNFGFL